MDERRKPEKVSMDHPVDGDRRLLLRAALTLGGCQALNASAWAQGGSLLGDNLIFADGFEPPGSPLDAVLDRIAAAHAAGRMWVRLDNCPKLGHPRFRTGTTKLTGTPTIPG